MNHKHKNWTLFFGIITAMVIVLSQLFWFQSNTVTKKSASAEQTDTKKDTSSEARISLPSSSLPSTSTVVVENDFSFIHEILFEEETANEASKTVVNTAGKFFHTLFRTIIAPNAP
jgi:hypothetical protein